LLREIMFPKIPFVFLLVSGVAFYWWRRPTLPPAVFLFIASIFLSRAYWEIAGATIRLEQLMALLLFAYFCLDLLRGRIRFHLPWPALMVLALFPLMLLSSLLGSPAPGQSLKKCLVYLPYMLAFLVLVHYLSSAEKLEEAWRAFYVFGATALSLSLIGFYLIYLGINVGMVRNEYGSFWLRGTMVVTNIMGSTAVIVFLAALIRLTGADSRHEKKRVLDMAVLAVSIAAVMMSYSRGAWLGAFLGMAVVAVLRWRKLVLKSSAVLLLVMAGSGVFVSITTTQNKWLKLEEKGGISMGEYGEGAEDAILHHKSDLHARGVDYLKKAKAFIKFEKHDQWRFQVARVALKDWRLSPILGRGTDSLQFGVKNKRPQDTFKFYIPITFLAVLHDWGLIGLLLFCAFLLAALCQLIRIYRSKIEAKWRDLALALLSVLVVSTFMYQISTTLQLSIFWCLLVFYAAAISLKSWPAAAISAEQK
jgi:hypothetical protein